MINSSKFEPEHESQELRTIANSVRALAQRYREDNIAILTLLRCLEELHQEIRDGMFQSSLPNNRREFNAFLKHVKDEGGWPHIERMNFQYLLGNLSSETGNNKYDVHVDKE